MLIKQFLAEVFRSDVQTHTREHVSCGRGPELTLQLIMSAMRALGDWPALGRTST